MAGIRGAAMEAIESVIWLADLVRTVLSDDDQDVVADLGAEDEGGAEITDVQMWGVAGVQSRPKDGSDDEGYAKAIRVQLGDYSIVIATHDPRHVEPCEPGELVVHALGKDGDRRALLRLKPDGSVDVDGTQIVIGNPDGTLQKIGLGDALQQHAEDVKSYVDGHTHDFIHTHSHPMGPTGPATPSATLAPSSPSPAVPTLASAKHWVEE